MASAQNDSYAVTSGLRLGAGRFVAPLDYSDQTSGSYNTLTDVWTPGRNASGVVTAASWALVPRNRWVQVAGTRPDVLDAMVKAVDPTFIDVGDSGWNAVFKAWSSCAVHPSLPRAYFFGGGHRDSSNNTVPRLDLDKMAWSVQFQPTNLVGADPRYSLAHAVTLTDWPEANDYLATLAGQNQNIVFKDEFYNYPKAGGLVPTARHTYNGLFIDPVRNRLVMCRERLWWLDLNTNQWSAQIPFGLNVGVYKDGPYHMGNGVVAWYDPDRDTYGVGGSTASAYEFVPSTGAFNALPRAPLGSVGHRSAFAITGSKVCGFAPEDSLGNGPWFYTLDLKTGRTTDSYLDVVGNVEPDLWDGNSDACVMCEMPSQGGFLVMGWYRATPSSSRRYRHFFLDPQKLTLSLIETPVGNWFPDAYIGDGGIYSLKFVPALRLIIAVAAADNDIRIMRLD